MKGHTVYLLFSSDERCLYVGCSMRGSARLRDHGKAPWWSEVAYAHFEHYDERRSALDRERLLIEQLAPLHNVKYGTPRTKPLDVVPSKPDGVAV